MATDKKFIPNIDNSDPADFPNGAIRDNDGSDNGTPINRALMSDLHEFFAAIMRMAGIDYNGVPDNVENGYQLVQAAAALAGKNDFIYELTSDGTTILIPTKIEILLDGETLLCKSAFNYAGETALKGSNPVAATRAVSTYVPGGGNGFKNGDYVRLIVQAGGAVVLVRDVDAINIGVVAGENAFLKAATTAEEYAGAILTAATTPYTNQLAFARRVIGIDSAMFLASTIRNGLLSKEDKAVIDGIVNPVKNVGWFSGVDPGTTPPGTVAPRSGNVISAVVALQTGPSVTYLVTLANAMSGLNYYVRSFMQSEGSIEFDNDIQAPVFKPISSTTFQWSVTQNPSSTKSIKVHIEVVQI